MLAKELTVVASQGMQAGRYDAMLDLIEQRRLAPSQLSTRTVALAETGEVLAAMDDYRTLGFCVIERVPSTIAALRAKQSKPILDEIRTWLMTQRALPRSSLGTAITYTSGLWPGLVRFLANPKIPLDTNGVERALRGVAAGRKNHCGSRSERGTRVAALFYSLIESAKIARVEPWAYLGEAARRPSAPRGRDARTRPQVAGIARMLTNGAQRWEDGEGSPNRHMAPIPGTAELPGGPGPTTEGRRS